MGWEWRALGMMKKTILVTGFFVLFGVLGLSAYFALVPPPEPSLEQPLEEIIATDVPGWTEEAMDLANSPESAARISDRLKFDDAFFRLYRRGNAFVMLYVAYWKPGKVPYRWAGAHTPDTCWVQAGFEREEREYKVPFSVNDTRFDPAEFGIYSKDGTAHRVHFWHLIGGEAYGYQQKGEHNIFGSLQDIRDYGLNLRQEQFFIRLSSNKRLETLKQMDGFTRILESLGELGLETDS